MTVKTKLTMATVLLLTAMSAFAQSSMQKKVQQKFPVWFDVRRIMSDGRKANKENRQLEANLGSYDKVQTKVDVFEVSLKSSCKKTEHFEVEVVSMASAGSGLPGRNDATTFPCASESMSVLLFPGVKTNIVMRSAAVTSRDINKVTITGEWAWRRPNGTVTSSGYDYTVDRRKEGAVLKGVIVRLKKDGTIIRIWSSLSNWRKMAWNENLDIRKAPGISSDDGNSGKGAN